MYFFYVDESGNRDPQTIGHAADGTIKPKDWLYVLLAVGLFEKRWFRFDREIANLKLELADSLFPTSQTRLTLADCEVKSSTLRHPRERKQRSPNFLSILPPKDLTRISTTFFEQVKRNNMPVFAVVIDKRKLMPHMTGELLHKKAYELLLERIESFMAEFHDKHNGLMVVDDTQTQLNHAVAMKHAFFQRQGNQNMRFRHIVEYPFFTDSRLSNGIQLADLCAYNVYRAFRDQNFAYSFFAEMLPNFYRSEKTSSTKLDGLKVFPDDSELVAFAAKEYQKWVNAGGVKLK